MQTDSIKASVSDTVSVRDGGKNKILRMLITEANLLIMAFFGYVGIQGLNDMSIKDSSRYLILNLIILYVIYKFFYIISNRLWVSFAAGGFVWYVMGLVNHYVGETRGVMFLPWDIMAFKTAASLALKEAAKKCDPVILEPIMDVEITVPTEYLGTVMGDVTKRRGHINDQEERGNAVVIRAYVPLSQMFGYATDLRSNTQGRGNYMMQMDHYAEVPAAIAEEIVKKNAR